VPVDHWHEVIGDPTIADAVLDRLVHALPSLTQPSCLTTAHPLRRRLTTGSTYNPNRKAVPPVLVHSLAVCG
jgi:hypothetical protein